MHELILKDCFSPFSPLFVNHFDYCSRFNLTTIISGFLKFRWEPHSILEWMTIFPKASQPFKDRICFFNEMFPASLTRTVLRWRIWCNNVVDNWLLDVIAGLTVVSPVTGLSYILIVVLLQELMVFSLQGTSLFYVHVLLRRVRYCRY